MMGYLYNLHNFYSFPPPEQLLENTIRTSNTTVAAFFLSDNQRHTIDAELLLRISILCPALDRRRTSGG